MATASIREGVKYVPRYRLYIYQPASCIIGYFYYTLKAHHLSNQEYSLRMAPRERALLLGMSETALVLLMDSSIR